MKRHLILSLVAAITAIAGIHGLETSANAQGIKFNPKDPNILKTIKNNVLSEVKKEVKKEVVKKDINKNVAKDLKKGANIANVNDPAAKGERVQKAIAVITAVKDVIQAVKGTGPGGFPGGGPLDQGGGGGFPGPIDQGGGPVPCPINQGGGPVPAPIDQGGGGVEPAPMVPPVLQDVPPSPPAPPAPVEDSPKAATPQSIKGDTEAGDRSLDGEREQVFTRRLLKVKNDSDASMKVYVQFRGLEEKKWAWIPADPTDAQDALVFELKPRQERYLTYRGEKIAASRVRIWGVGESQSWLEYRDKDLWIVPETDARGEHRYLATEMRTFSQVFTPEAVGDK